MDHDDREQLDRLAAGGDDVTLFPYAVELLDDLHDADLVVAMGGYKTAAEIIANRKAAVIVPRVAPRQEQLVRARILRDLGFIWLVEPEEDVVTALRAYVSAALAGEHPERLSHCDIDVGGAARAGSELDALLRTGSLFDMVAS
jgi:predicted glycosyltransferase